MLYFFFGKVSVGETWVSYSLKYFFYTKQPAGCHIHCTQFVMVPNNDKSSYTPSKKLCSCKTILPSRLTYTNAAIEAVLEVEERERGGGGFTSAKINYHL